MRMCTCVYSGVPLCMYLRSCVYARTRVCMHVCVYLCVCVCLCAWCVYVVGIREGRGGLNVQTSCCCQNERDGKGEKEGWGGMQEERGGVLQIIGHFKGFVTVVLKPCVYVCVCMREREKVRERARERASEREGERRREGGGETGRERAGESERERGRASERESE